MSKMKREQTRNAESIDNARQDRNTFVTDGGTWSWVAGTGTLSWSATFYILRGGATAHAVIGPGSIVGLTGLGAVAFVDVDRFGGGTVVAEGGSSPGPSTLIGSADNDSDERLVLGVRGSDGKLYMRDGTIFTDGDSKTLGTLNAATDRGDGTASGASDDTVPFTYVTGSGQLAVYLDGVFQVLGTHYTETDSTTITWTALGQPVGGEQLSFVNLVGGQGPSGGAGDLQDAYNNGSVVDVTAGSIARFVNTVGSAALGVDDAASGVANFLVEGGGDVFVSSGDAGLHLRDNGGTDFWNLVPLDDLSGDLILYNTDSGAGIRYDKGTGAVEHGTYAGSYPGGSWTPDGNGGIKWAVYSGTIDAAGADEVIATGLSNIIGVILSVSDSVLGDEAALDMAYGAFSTKRIAARFDASTGDVTLSGNLNISQAIGSHLWSEAYTAIVIYQG